MSTSPQPPDGRPKGLLGTTDAMIWAEEFCRIFKGCVVIPNAADHKLLAEFESSQFISILDEGTMVAWFANAVEVGRNAGRQETCPHPEFHVVSEEMRICTTCGLAEYGYGEETLEESFLEGFQEGRPV